MLDPHGRTAHDRLRTRPEKPCAFADVAAVAGHPALLAFNGAVVIREFNVMKRLFGARFDYAPIHEDAAVHNWPQFWKKHLTGMRLLGIGLGAAGVLGLFGGLGIAYGAAYLTWMVGYFGFEPKRNAAIFPDWRQAHAWAGAPNRPL